MFTITLDQQTSTRVRSTARVQRQGTSEAQDLADAFAEARDNLAAVLGLRTSTWSVVVLRAIPGDREFEVDFRNCEPNDRDDDALWAEPRTPAEVLAETERWWEACKATQQHA